MADSNTTGTFEADNDKFEVFSYHEEGEAGADDVDVVVPDGEFWVLESASIKNTEGSTARSCSISILDEDDVVRAVLGDGVLPVSVAAGSFYGWTGKIYVPEGWTVRGTIASSGGAVVGELKVYGVRVRNALTARHFSVS